MKRWAGVTTVVLPEGHAYGKHADEGELEADEAMVGFTGTDFGDAAIASDGGAVDAKLVPTSVAPVRAVRVV